MTAQDPCLTCGAILPPNGHVANYFDTRFGHPDLYRITVCQKCGLEQTLPRPDAKSLQRLYETYYNFGGESGTRYTRLREQLMLSPVYKAWLWMDGDVAFHDRRGTGRLLDIGCNEGRGLLRYAKNGFQAEGFEFNEKAAQAARTRGFKVHTAPLEQLPASEFDVVVLSNVLEHALDPRAMLSSIKRLLKPGGQLWISCPNNQSFLKNIFGRYWINWHVPFHVAHFSPQGLESLLVESGFRVIDRSEATPALWVTQSLLTSLFARRGTPTRQLRSAWLVAPLLVTMRMLLFPFFWIANRFGKGDCLVFRAVKDS